MLVNTHTEKEFLGDGRIRQIHYVAPIAFKDEGGVLQRIVNDFVDGDATFPHIVSAAPMLLYTAGDGLRRMCPTRDPQVYIEIGAPYIKPAATWQQVNLGAATRTDNKITWSVAQADVSIVFGGHFAKLEIALKGGYEPPNGQFAFPVGLNGLTRQGMTILHNNVPVMLLNKPVVYDADNRGDVRSIAAQFVNVSGQNYILFTLPSLAGMTSPVVDPTLTIQPDATAGIDTWLEKNAPDANTGMDTKLQLTPEESAPARALLKFDVSSIPSGAVIFSGVFSIWNQSSTAYSNAFELNNILAANSAWTESDATWNYALASSVRWAGDVGADGGADAGCSVSGIDYDATLLGSFTIAADAPADTENQCNLTPSKLTAWLTSNYGFLFSEPSNYQYQFRSSDYGTAAYRPKLTIVYTLPGITFDAVSNSPYEAALSTYNWTHTVGASAIFRGLVVSVAVLLTGTVTSITCGSLTLNLIRADTNGAIRTEVWYVANPPIGANTITVTLNTSLTSISSAVSYSLCGGPAALGGSTGTGGTVAASTTTNLNSSLLFAALACQTASGVGDDASQTNRGGNNGALGTLRASEKGLVSPPASTTLTFTGVGGIDLWAISEVELYSIVHTPFPIRR